MTGATTTHAFRIGRRLLVLAVVARVAHAQTQYHNLDAGRPGRVEDADPTSRYALDVDLAPFQIERLAGGTTRYRAEPKLSYGVLPFTELELRLPFVQVNPPNGSGAQAVAGMAGITLGAMHAFTLETTQFPALAIASEVSLPVGSLGADRASYLVKGLMTKTIGFARVHLNAGAGSYAIRSPTKSNGATCSSFTIVIPGDTTCGGGSIIIIDMPCSVSPSVPGRLSTASARMCMATLAETTTTATPRISGGRWFAGAAVDHSFALQSTMVSADLFAERFIGLYPTVDWTAEVGVRHQLTPVLVVDAGVGRHFAGAIHSTSVIVGATYEFATPPLIGR